MYRLGRFGIKLELDTISDILNLLDSPQKSFTAIHIAGTNGKGSIGTYIAEILARSGHNTGLYTSPHLVRFNERFAVNGTPVSDDEIVTAYMAVNEADRGQRKATFFEIATAMAFYLFARRGVEFAVIETGMGGRFDATNIIRPAVSIISNLSIEHTDYLGSTIRDLAVEKGGIIKENTPLVTGVTQPSGLSKLFETAREKNAPVHVFRKDFKVRNNKAKNTFSYFGLSTRFRDLKTGLKGSHQIENAALAIAGCEIVAKHPDLAYPDRLLDPVNIQESLKNAQWPGRLEYIMEEPLVIIDGAHNLKASAVLGSYLSEHFPGRKITLVLGMLDDKPYEKMLKNLLPAAGRVILTRADNDRSIDPVVLEQCARLYTDAPVMIEPCVGRAVEKAVSEAETDEVVCIAGSLYVAGEAREKIETEMKSPVDF
jgi:dihydrofolate synthase/folylpolyglutamate synthase